MQTLLVHVSVALQHRTPAEPVEQLWVVAAHTAAAWQVPCVAPSGMLQAEPAQQSASPVQVPPVAWQEVDVPEPSVQSAHLPLVQVPLQQSVPAVQVPPVSLQMDTGVTGVVPAKGRHAKNPASPYLVQVSPEPVQQLVSAAPVQDAPKGLHAGVPPPHFRIIPALGSGAHAWPLQHWSLNWQTAPGSTQHRGFVAS